MIKRNRINVVVSLVGKVLFGIVLCLGIYVIVGPAFKVGLEVDPGVQTNLETSASSITGVQGAGKNNTLVLNSDTSSDLDSPSNQAKQNRGTDAEARESTLLGQGPLAIPSRDQLRKEIKANPHRTPQAVLEFASTLAPKMALALKSEGAGHRFFEELQRCVLSQAHQSSAVIRAICLSNAGLLGKNYSSLQVSYQVLLEKADPESVRLSQIP